ncbi:helix-turn-helix domain-containing protein [uncultured Roseibium sp.]|uniref:helix-turn-helix domain-containing protein n=1 Tax=uncultured Roseibium sp. TaxID=1936171 RepID=UPI0032173993
MAKLFNTRLMVAPARILTDLTTPEFTRSVTRSVGLEDTFCEGPPAFAPYQLQARWFEEAARKLGEPHLGALIGTKIRYGDLGNYAQYVLEAPNVAKALGRAKQALSFIVSASHFETAITENCLVLRYSTGIESTIGTRHIEEAIPLLFTDFMRNFAGPGWKPAWIERPARDGLPGRTLAEGHYANVPVRLGPMAGLAIPLSDLLLPNPSPPDGQARLTFSDLPSLAGSAVPSSFSDVVRDLLKLQLRVGNAPEDVVASRLGLGIRTFQRRLRTEGYTFRELRLEETMRRAAALLSTGDLNIAETAFALGYEEPNSFRRAFQKFFDVAPSQYRQL